MGVLREIDRRSSWLSALGRLPYMDGEKKLAVRLGRPMASHRLRSSCACMGRLQNCALSADSDACPVTFNLAHGMDPPCYLIL